MANDVTSEIVISSPDREQALRAVAREHLRAWMRPGGSIALERIGRDAIRDAADATARTSRSVEPASTEGILADIERFAAALTEPPKARTRWWSSRRPEADPPTASDLAALIERLDRQRDVLTRRMISLQTDRQRFVVLDAALEDAVHLIRAFGPVVEAAVQELRVQGGGEAARIEAETAAALLDRQRAVLTQLAVHRQAIMTLDMIISNETTLSAALEQARTATVSALQVAMAARRAAADGTLIARQGAALAQTIDRARAGKAGGSEHARRMLEDALTQARTAIAAMSDRGKR